MVIQAVIHILNTEQNLIGNMGILDRLFKKRTKQNKRSYTGASTGRLMNDFLTTTLAADSEIKQNLKTLRARSRELARNNAYARRFINAYVDNVIGPNGVHLQVRSRDPNGAMDTFANNIIEGQFKKWGRSVTADGKMSWLEAQRLFAETYARDGEVIVRLIKNFDNPYRFAFEFIESDFLDHEYNDHNKNIRMGVERDKFGRPLYYHILKNHPNDTSFPTYENYSNRYQRIPADQIIHFYHQERPHQTRGVPPLSACIRDLKMLDGYMEAELVAARVSASKMGFFKSGGADGYQGEDLMDTHTPVMSASPGNFEQLPIGMEFQAFDPQHPTTAFRDFTKGVLRAIASSLGVSYNTLANDLESVNYSSLRQGALEERDHWKCEQSKIIDKFHNVIFEHWLDMALLTDLLNGLPASKYNKFNTAVWKPRGWQWIDPKKEIDALAVGMANGFISYSDVQASYGRDIEDVFAQIQYEREMAKEYGITTAFEPFGSQEKIADVTGNDEEN